MKTVVLIRHAIAKDKIKFSKSGLADSYRPLTLKGRKRFRKGAKGLRTVLKNGDLILSSPLVRAWQTSEILSEVYNQPITACAALKPTATLKQFCDFLEKQKGEVIFCVGHEPHLSNLVKQFCFGENEAPFEFKKGGALALSFKQKIAPGKAQILWFLSPKMLRKLA